MSATEAVNELTFVDELPEHGGKQGMSERRVKELKAQPNRWALWPTRSGSAAVKKALAPFGDDFDVVTRRTEGAMRVFVRYCPPETGGRTNGTAARSGAPSAVENGSARPKAKCPTCAQFINIEPGEDTAKALARHERTSLVCKATNRNRH